MTNTPNQPQEPIYRVQIYGPDEKDMPLLTFESARPFMAFSVGDLISPNCYNSIQMREQEEQALALARPLLEIGNDLTNVPKPTATPILKTLEIIEIKHELLQAESHLEVIVYLRTKYKDKSN